MLKKRAEQIQFLMRIVDFLLTTFAFLLAFHLQDLRILPHSQGISNLQNFLWLLPSSLVLHFLIYPYYKLYDSLRMRSVGDLFRSVLQSSLSEFLVLGTLVFLFQAKETSRYFFVFFIITNYLFAFLIRVTARTALTQIRIRGYNFRRVLIIGAGLNASRVFHALDQNKHWGYLSVGILKNENAPEIHADLKGLKNFGDLRELKTIIEKNAIDDIIFAPDTINADDWAFALGIASAIGIPIRFSMGLIEIPGSKMIFNNLGGIPLITYHSTLRTPTEDALKRTIDIIGSLVGLLITSLLYPWISYKIRKESPGPVFFKQTRIGENGRHFRCYKFRTMQVDAEQKKNELLSHNEMTDKLFKIKNDPRIFPFGQWLRKTSLDELPQFLNVLRGEMSLVGTRPPTPDEVEKYSLQDRRRLSIRPGITGLWQISGRNTIKSFNQVLELDLWYIDHWSIFLDFTILFKTIWVVVSRKGAH